MNSNIRCIEINLNDAGSSYSAGWIVTLDVLKYAKSINNLCAILLNSNIRCIEIHIQLQCANSPGGWIVTLDVLKFGHKSNNYSFS